METTTQTTTMTTPAPWKDKLTEYLILHSGALLAALVIVVVGFIAAHYVGKLMGSWLEKRSMEPPVRMLFTRLTKLLVLVIALVIALGTAGMDVTALIAGISIAGVGVGLAMQGVLGNLFAGLTIIFTKPFRVNEYIAIHGVEGQVSQIELFTTTLIHGDRSRVVIPNRKIIGEILHNYGTIRQLDLAVGVGYGTNLAEALQVVSEIVKANPRVLKDPSPVIGVGALADSSINLVMKPWTTVADYGPAAGEIYQAIAKRFREHKIEIPFPQREVRLLNAS